MGGERLPLWVRAWQWLEKHLDELGRVWLHAGTRNGPWL